MTLDLIAAEFTPDSPLNFAPCPKSDGIHSDTLTAAYRGKPVGSYTVIGYAVCTGPKDGDPNTVHPVVLHPEWGVMTWPELRDSLWGDIENATYTVRVPFSHG